MNLPAEFEIPNAVPPSLNEYLRMNIYARNKLKYVWRGYVLAYVIRTGADREFWRKLREAKTKLKIEVTFHHSREFDKDNAYGAAKVLFDALKGQGVIFDDRSEFLEQIVTQQKSQRAKSFTRIIIERADGEAKGN